MGQSKLKRARKDSTAMVVAPRKAYLKKAVTNGDRFAGFHHSPDKAEVHRADFGLTPALFFSGGTPSVPQVTAMQIVCLNPISRGDSVLQRTGNQIVMKSINIKGSVTFTALTTWLSTDATSGQWQWALYYDRNTLGVSPAATDFQEVDAIQGLPNLDAGNRFTCLKKWQSPVVARVNGVNATHSFDEYIKLPDLVTRFNSLNTGLVNSVEVGGLFLVTYQTGALPAPLDNQSILSYRLRFTG